MTTTTVRAPHRFHLKRLSVRLLCLLAVVALYGLGKTSLFSPLPSGAYPVLSTAGWVGTVPGSPNYTSFQWLPNGDLAHIEIGPHGRFQVCYQRMDADGPTGPIRRGLEVPPLPNMPPGFQNAGFIFSPDEQWVACVWSSGPYITRTLLVSADGKTTRTIPEYFLEWMTEDQVEILRSSAVGRPTANI